MKIGKIIKEIRESKGLTRKDVYESLGIGRAALGHYENDDNQVPFEVLAGMSKLYGVTIGELFGEKPNTQDEKGNSISSFLDSALEMLYQSGMLEKVDKFEDLDENLKLIVISAINKVIQEKKKEDTSN